MRHSWAIVAALAVSSSALADDASENVKGVCIANALETYSSVVGELTSREGFKLPTVDAVLERRHLAEAFCLQHAKCDVAADKKEGALGLMFEACLRDDVLLLEKAVQEQRKLWQQQQQAR